MAIALAGIVAACGPSQREPRGFFFFMEDGLAREGVLARCNLDRVATANDEECANARRAAAALAAEQEPGRSARLARESERKLNALRARTASAALSEQNAAAAVRAAADAAYESQWRGPHGPPVEAAVDAIAPAFGAPLGAVLPSMSESRLFDVRADEQSPGAPNSELVSGAAAADAIPAVTPTPELVVEEMAIIPRPFRPLDGVAVPQ